MLPGHTTFIIYLNQKLI